MYDVEAQLTAPGVRIVNLAAALDRHATVHRIWGGRLARTTAALRWWRRVGWGAIDGVYVESATSWAAPFDLLFLALARLHRKPVGVYFRDAYQLHRELYPRIRRRQVLTDWLWGLTTPALCHLATVRFVPSSGLAEMIGLRTFSLLPPGTDPSLPNLGAGREPIVAYVGGLDRSDGVETLIEAMAGVREALPGASLRIVSPVDPRRVLGPLPGWIGWLATGRGGLANALRDARVCVIPRPLNRYTDLAVPVKLMDYLSLGKPIVATRAAETERLVAASRAALLVGDTAAALAAGIARVLTEPDVATGLADRARALAEDPRLTWDGRAGRLITVLLGTDAAPAITP